MASQFSKNNVTTGFVSLGGNVDANAFGMLTQLHIISAAVSQAAVSCFFAQPFCI